MSGWQWFFAAYLGLSGLIVFGRGCARSTRQYTIFDGVGGLIEMAVLIWIVAVYL